MGTTIRDIPILDLRSVSADAIAQIDLVENVKTVVLSTENVEAFMEVPRVEVRSHLIIHPEETLFIGQIEFNDEFLEQLAANTKLVILGHVIIDGFTIELFQDRVQSFRSYGQIIYANARSAGALLARLERLQGQLIRMRPNSIRWIGTTLMNVEKLETLSGRPVLCIGPLTIDSDLPPSEITEHISSMVHIGELFGPEEAICALFSVCDRRLGTYKARAHAPEPAYSVAMS
jgi:hypothetical protein